MIAVFGETYDALLGLRSLLGKTEAEESLANNMPAFQGTAFGEPLRAFTVGQTNYLTTLCAEKAILKYHPDVVFFLGESTALSPQLALGDVVLGNRLFFYGVNFNEQGLRYGAIPGYEPYFYSDLTLARLGEDVAKNMPGVRALRGDILSGEKKIVDQGEFASIMMRHYTNAGHLLCYDLGSAGIAFACKEEHIPFLPLKAVTYLPLEGDEGQLKERRVSLTANIAAGKLLYAILKRRKEGTL